MKQLMISRIIKFTALLVPIAIIVLLLQSYVFVFVDNNTSRISNYYDEAPNSLDVVFLGASDVFTGFSPGYAYGKYGFTSYMYAMDANLGSLYKAQLKEIRSQQTPQVIVVEVYGFLKTAEQQADATRMRMFTERIPLSANKIETVFSFEYDDWTSCFFPFVRYHADWDSASVRIAQLLKDPSSIDAPAMLKGMYSQTAIYTGTGDDETQDPAGWELDDLSEKYLIEFLEYCKQENIGNVVFVNFPKYLADEENSKLLSRTEAASQIIKQHGFTYYNLQDLKAEYDLDFQTDFYNPHHLNVYGQMKLTDYLGDIIVNDLKITPMTQTDVNKAHWEQCAQYADEYFAFADEAIQAGEFLHIGMEPSTLELLAQRRERLEGAQ